MKPKPSDQTVAAQPAPDRDQTVDHSDQSLDAGLAAAFGRDSTPGGWTNPPTLWDDGSHPGSSVEPRSPEMPAAVDDGYQFHGEIARGGMGVILKGHDPDLGRDVAFKVLRSELVHKPAVMQRFVEEAQVGGQLQHPGIVPIYNLGRFKDGRPYFAMKLVQGRNLGEMLDERKKPGKDRGRYLQIFLQVCQTMAYAHSRGVIHRDLKPANIMVGAFGEVLIMDWGLAKVLSRGDTLRGTDTATAEQPDAVLLQAGRMETLAGSVLGTPAFMPPEQARGAIDLLDERTDVFGLGAILCVILTGSPPYDGKDAAAMLAMATKGNIGPAKKRLDACGADRELIELCKQCLAPERDARPRNADEVATSLTAYLTATEERARQAEVERAEQAVKTQEERKRRRVQAALGMAFTVLVVMVGAAGWWFDRYAREREALRTRTEESVNIALNDAAIRTLEAWKSTDDSRRMRNETDHVLAAVTRGEGYANTGAPSPELLDMLKSARADADELDRHTRLLYSADEILGNHDVVATGGHGGQRTIRGLAEAFKDFGWDVHAFPPNELGEKIAQSRIRNKVLGLWLNWDFQSGNNPVERKKVRAVVREARLASGGVLGRWQAALDGGNKEKVLALSDDPEIFELGPELLLSLCGDIRESGFPEREVTLLRVAADRYPRHVWIHFDLMRACMKRPDLKAEAIRYGAAAAAARPDNALVQYNLGIALANSGGLDAATVAFQRAILVAPKYASVYIDLAGVREKKGDIAGAMAAYEGAIKAKPSNTIAANAHYRLGSLHLRDKNFDEAIRSLQSAVQLTPGNATYIKQLDSALIQKMKSQKQE